VAVRAAESKKASGIKVLDLTGITSFADYFVICTGSNPKQVQAIADEVGSQLKQLGEHPYSLEGYTQAEWILADYGDILVHVFSTQAREYYDLERLWRAAKTVAIPVDESRDARELTSAPAQVVDGEVDEAPAAEAASEASGADN